MAGNGEGERSSSRNVGASINADATEARYPLQDRWRRWGGCWGGLSCLGSQKGGKRIVPSSRVPEGNTSANRANGSQPIGLTNQTPTINPSLLAPPSSPVSLTNSSLPSTAQSPTCFLSMSVNSPVGGPSSTMYVTGPYAHETQLVSPPVFSTYTTEPSTAPITPPPEVNHHPTTPSSPDVPFAQFLSSSHVVAANGLQATYSLYPGSPASSLISPISGTSGDGLSSSFPKREFPSQWGGVPLSSQDSQSPRSPSSNRLFGLDASMSKNFMLSQDSSFFYPATSAQFYLDQANVLSSNGNGHQNRHNRNCKPDVEEIEAYRASFGFSADEIITTPQYVEIADDVLDDSFSMAPFTSNKPTVEESIGGESTQTTQTNMVDQQVILKFGSGLVAEETGGNKELCSGVCRGKPPNSSEDHISQKVCGNDLTMTDDERNIFSKMGNSKVSKRCGLGLSSSDAEIDYRRGFRSLREGKVDFSWQA